MDIKSQNTDEMSVRRFVCGNLWIDNYTLYSRRAHVSANLICVELNYDENIRQCGECHAYRVSVLICPDLCFAARCVASEYRRSQ